LKVKVNSGGIVLFICGDIAMVRMKIAFAFCAKH